MESLGTWIVGSIIFLLIILAAHRVYSDHKNGKGCGCDCSGCSKCPDKAEPYN